MNDFYRGLSPYCYIINAIFNAKKTGFSDNLNIRSYKQKIMNLLTFSDVYQASLLAFFFRSHSLK